MKLVFTSRQAQAAMASGSRYLARRIGERDRLVYVVAEDAITIVQARYHY
jgi:Txe/YoeB family toxin of Txe-Axe toxin-antitoxin module